jgi:transposase
MSLHPTPVGDVPEETARVARAAFPRGNPWLRLRDELGAVYEDTAFTGLFAARGQPAAAPWRLALVTVLQFAEGLSDRQAAEAVRARIDWKYVLGLALDDPGFDHSVLCEFRGRLVAGGAEALLLDRLLEVCRARKLLRAKGKQRTDSTHVLGALRVLNRLERVAETLRAALNAVAAVAPEWLRAVAPPEWYERYARRIEDDRLPKGADARRVYGEAVGTDGVRLLEAVYAPEAPPDVRALVAVEVLRQTWVQHYLVDGPSGCVRLREAKDMPPPSAALESPYEVDARFGTKGGRSWTGYKVHLTETCDDALPHLVTQVHTTIAPVHDVTELVTIQAALAQRDLLPAQHFVDAGYVRARNLVASTARGVELVGPIFGDRQWQAHEPGAFDVTQFRIDWDARVVTCPQGHPSRSWCEAHDRVRHRDLVKVSFSKETCLPCPVRERCTRSAQQVRTLTLHRRDEHEAVQAARLRQQTDAFAALYALRAGAEGSLSQGIRRCGLRRARYRGLAKTHLQHAATAAALNLARLATWLAGDPLATTRTSRFAALALAA